MPTCYIGTIRSARLNSVYIKRNIHIVENTKLFIYTQFLCWPRVQSSAQQAFLVHFVILHFQLLVFYISVKCQNEFDETITVSVDNMMRCDEYNDCVDGQDEKDCGK